MCNLITLLISTVMKIRTSFYRHTSIKSPSRDKKISFDDDGNPVYIDESTGEAHGLPDFLVIGEQKCGTGRKEKKTSMMTRCSKQNLIILSLKTGALRNFLEHHNQILGAKTLESQFFSWKWKKNPLSWYLKKMAVKSQGKVTFEKTASYIRLEGAAYRIHRLMPDAKFIVLVIDPVKR